MDLTLTYADKELRSLYMEPNSGFVQTLEEWISDYQSRDSEDLEENLQDIDKNELVEVIYDEKSSSWIEA